MKISAKYDMLYPPLVERVLAEESGAKDPVKSAKTRLHQMYGAYVQGNAHKKAAAFLDEMDALNAMDISEALLELHASTSERMEELDEFLDFIESHIPSVKSILDLGCGFNPFSIPFLPPKWLKKLKAYYAYDIDTRTKDLLNRFFSLLNLPQTACCADLVTETPQETVDLAFLCKLLPVLEAQLPGRGFELAESLNARFLVITYPLKSLGGREKGMEKNYSAAFEKAMSGKIIDSSRIGDELVYICKGADRIELV